MRVLAIDEAGKCPVLGSIWIAGVVIHEEFAENLFKEGRINDCKKLSRATIENLKQELDAFVDCYYIRRLSPALIDFDCGLNLNDKEMVLVMDIITEALSKFSDIQKIYVDNFEVSLDKFKERMKQVGYDYSCYKDFMVVEHQADEKYPPVMIASIYAKYYRQKEEELFKPLAGSGNPNDKKTIKYIKLVLSGILKDEGWIRYSWITVQRLKEQINKKNS